MALWLGSFQSKSYLDRIKQIDNMYGIFTRDIALLERLLTQVKERARYLFTEAQHHQLQLEELNSEKRVLSKNQIEILNDLYMDVMEKTLDAQKMISLSGITRLKVEVSDAVGFTEEIKLLPLPSRRSRRMMESDIELEDEVELAKGLFRNFQMEGTIGDVAYATAVSVKRNIGKECGKAMNINDLKMVSQNPIPRKMLSQARVNLPETMYCFSNDLYFYKLLQEERQETVDRMESEVSGLEDVEHGEPVVLHLQTQGNHEAQVVWGLLWDDLNQIFKYNISLNCSQEVVTRFSRSNLYQYLSGQQKLKTHEDVIAFAKRFTAL